MEFTEFLKLIGRKKQTMCIIIFVAVVLTVGLSLLSPLKYASTSRLLVLQNSNSADAYTLSKSNEYLGNLFAQVVYSGSFYDRVKTSDYNVDSNYFTGNYSQQLKKWHQTVKTTTQGDTGIIEINVYHPDVQEAIQISLAINDILINKNQDYHSGQNVKVNMIDQPLVSNYPVKPNLPYNSALAVTISFVISLFYIYINPEEEEEKKTIKKANTETVKKEVTYVPVREIVDQVQSEYQQRQNQSRPEPDLSGNISGNMSNVLRK